MDATAKLRRDPRLKAVRWHDLLQLAPGERLWEITLSFPWLASSLFLYGSGWILPGAICSFFFFLTGLRQAHGAQHYTLGLGRRPQDLILFILSVLMLASMHAVQVTHMHHHRHCLAEDDFEASTARLPWWRAILAGPWFIAGLHLEAWRLAKPGKRRWIAIELIALSLAVALVGFVADIVALRWHVIAMGAGECLTGFFAVWTVHHHCDPVRQIARTQRGWLKNVISYEMFFHLEHHLFPAVPTPRLPELADRIDAVAPDLTRKHVY